MGFIKDIYKFIAKLNKREPPYVITDEEITLIDGKWEGFMSHDNVLEETIEIYTLLGRQGSKVLNYTINKQEWKIYLKVFSQEEKVYISYETYGDTVEAEDINMLQIAADYLGQRLIAHEDNTSNPHVVTKTQVGLSNVDNVQQATKIEFNEHKGNTANPHGVTKAQVGLSNVENVRQATKIEFDSHNNDNTRHLSAAERNTWNDKYTRNEVDNKLSALETKIDWKESVGTYSDIATTYPNPEDGWTVNVKDTNYTYRFTGNNWIPISANAIPKATQSVDGLLSKEDKVSYDDANNKKHTHSNKSIIDTITSALTTNWNAAYTHISDSIKHITANERTLWNSVSNKVDQISGKGLSTEDYTTTEKTKLTGIEAEANKYIHPPSHPSTMIAEDSTHRFATDTEKATWNGKLAPSGDGSNLTNSFSQASTRANLSSGETISISLGKLMKWFVDLKIVAFSGSYSDLSDKPVIPTSLPASGGNAATVNGHTVELDVPANAKFTDTVYTHPSSHSPSIIAQNTSNRFVTDSEKMTWHGKQDSLGYVPINKVGDEMEGALLLASSTLLLVPLRIPHGVTPTAPNNGDMWSTTSGLFFRQNGTTRTMAHTASWSTISQAEAEAGTATSQRLWTAQRVKQAIDANAMPKGSISWGQLKGV